MAEGGEGARVDVVLSLPPRLARAITGAAEAAGRIDAEGRVVMDHMVMMPEESPLWKGTDHHATGGVFKTPSTAC